MRMNLTFGETRRGERRYRHFQGAGKSVVIPTIAVSLVHAIEYAFPELFEILDLSEAVATGMVSAGLAYLKNIAKHYFKIPF